MENHLERPVHLYVKTHRRTGLKYFGRTTEDPYSYSGSGAYWVKHLAMYGNDVTTSVVGTYTDNFALRAKAKAFSAENNIATSTEWANLLPEDGGISGDGWSASQDHRAQIAALDAAVQRRLGGSGGNEPKYSAVGSQQAGRTERPKGYYNGLIGLIVVIVILMIIGNYWYDNVRTCVLRDAETHEIVQTGVPCPDQR